MNEDTRCLIKLHALICEREGMVASNKIAEMKQEYPLHEMDDFMRLANDMRAIGDN